MLAIVMEVVQLSMQTNRISVMRLIEWCIGRAAMRMLLAVSRMRMRLTIHRVRTRALVVGSPSVAPSSLRQAYLRLRRYQPNITYSEKRMACELLAFMTTDTSRFLTSRKYKKMKIKGGFSQSTGGCIGRTTMRMLMAVSRMRMRITIHRMRTRTLVVGSQTIKL